MALSGLGRQLYLDPAPAKIIWPTFIWSPKRVLEEDEFKIFRFHFLLGADWKLCCQRLNLDRGDFLPCRLTGSSRNSAASIGRFARTRSFDR